MDNFDGKRFSQFLDIGKLERETRKYLYSGLLIALFLNVCGMVLFPSRNQPEVRLSRSEFRRIITTDIVVLHPRKTLSPFAIAAPRTSSLKPMSRRTIRHGISLPSQTGSLGKGLSPLLRDESSLLSFESPSAPAEFSKGEMDALIALPQGHAPIPGVERRAGKDTPLREEMLTPEDFAWAKEGVRTGLVEYNSKNKFSLRGIVPIPIVHGRDGGTLSSGMDMFWREIENYTDLAVGKIRQFALIQNTPLDYPFLYITDPGDPDDMAPEILRLREYIQGGGFVLFECTNMRKEAAMRKFVRKALGPKCRLHPLPGTHPVYTCYFDYPDGVPGAVESARTEDDEWTSIAGLEGAEINGRLVAVYSTSKFLCGGRPGGVRMAINLLVYALRQDGGFAVKRENPGLEPGVRAMRNVAGTLLTPETGKRQ